MNRFTPGAPAAAMAWTRQLFPNDSRIEGGTDHFNGLTVLAHLNQPSSFTGNTNEAGWVEFAYLVFHRFAFRVCMLIHAATVKPQRERFDYCSVFDFRKPLRLSKMALVAA